SRRFSRWASEACASNAGRAVAGSGGVDVELVMVDSSASNAAGPEPRPDALPSYDPPPRPVRPPPPLLPAGCPDARHVLDREEIHDESLPPILPDAQRPRDLHLAVGERHGPALGEDDVDDVLHARRLAE